MLIPYVTARQEQRRLASDSGLTMSRVLDLIVLAAESGVAVVDKYRDGMPGHGLTTARRGGG